VNPSDSDASWFRSPSTDRRGEQDLDDLLVHVARGDEVAFEAVYDRLAGPVYGVIRRVLRDPAQSEEVAQEVLLEVWRTATRFDPAMGGAATWVMTIAHRRAIDRVRATTAAAEREHKTAGILRGRLPMDSWRAQFSTARKATCVPDHEGSPRVTTSGHPISVEPSLPGSDPSAAQLASNWLEVASHRLHARWNPARLQQRTDVVRITGQHHVRRRGQERYVRIDDIGRTSPGEQFAYPRAVVFAQCLDADTRQHAREIRLPAAIAPYLTNDCGTRPQRRPSLLEHPQLSTYGPVATVNGDQRPGV
jgi:RNA polymerase sigma factor (sigma-70 family)